MEQEQDNPVDNNIVQRMGYSLTIAAHVVFIATAIIGTVILLAVLLIQ